MWEVSSVIQTSMESPGAISRLVVFPRSEFLVGPPSLKHIKSVALLGLADATVWMLVLERQDWTKERLRASAEVLAGVSKQAFTTGTVERLLRKQLGIKSLPAATLPIGRIDELVWETEKVAFALVRQPAANRSDARIRGSSLGEIEWTVRTRLRASLNDELRSFVKAMDPEALRIATAGRRFDLRVYNYLAHTEYRRYRLQFAETFPSLLQSAVVAEPRSLGKDLRSIVDSGAPLIKGLAARWNVRPGAIRHLVGRASSNVGVQWSRDARGLALALNALHPQDLPADNASEWGEFNRIVVTGQRLFHQPVWESAAGLEWLRECIRLVRTGDKPALERWLPGWNQIEQVIRFRKALAETLRREILGNRDILGDDADTTIDDAVDRFVLKIARRGLQDVASLFAEELIRTWEKDYACQILSREVLLPLVPQDYVASDGRTRVTALTTDRELRTHGSRCKIGSVFIVGLYDVPSDRPLSTAEIRTFSNRKPSEYRLYTRQHTAAANRRPSARCVRVLRDFLRYCHTDEVREHLLSNWRSVQGCAGREHRQPVDAPAALRRALGDNTYDGLLSRIRDTNKSGGAGMTSG